MADLSTIPHQLDEKKGTCRAIIETPKGFRNKFDFDRDSNLFMLGGLLPEGMMFPFDFGFIPSTLGEDGDPLDILVLMDAPAHVGCLMPNRPRTARRRPTTACSASRFTRTITKT